ncbi:MAG: RNA polymerase sigma factor [Paraglaciecola sp.]|uniref:RNA polymerase sigma factor n=1 Tax=Paraglaciecola sp. TaxID=1920173 RepID=UPI00326361B5
MSAETHIKNRDLQVYLESHELSEAQGALIGELFSQHNDMLLRFLRARLPSDSDAHEVAQEAYVKLLDLDNPSAISYLRAYLFKTASNLAADHLRSEQRASHYRPMVFFKEEQPSEEQTALVNEKIELLHEFVQELPAKCRKAFMLSRYHDMTTTEIAQLMRLSDRMVRKYLVRATEHCQMRLEEATGGRR